MKPLRAAALLLAAAACGAAGAAEFKSAAECRVGQAVADRNGKTGTVVSVQGTLCSVKFDGEGQAQARIFWMLRPAGASTQPADVLAPGLYTCYTLAGSTLNYAFIDIHIDSTTAYRDKQGKAGRYRLEPGGRIVFESGSLQAAHAKLLAGPRIGLNMTGGSFFNTTCSPKR